MRPCFVDSFVKTTLITASEGMIFFMQSQGFNNFFITFADKPIIMATKKVPSRRNKLAGKGKSKSSAKKKAYDTKYHSTTKRKKYRAELNRANKKAGTYGNGDGLDMSHTKKGKLVKEKASTNRARNKKGKSKK